MYCVGDIGRFQLLYFASCVCRFVRQLVSCFFSGSQTCKLAVAGPFQSLYSNGSSYCRASLSILRMWLPVVQVIGNECTSLFIADIG